MFKLKFFILFALAGICFGDTSASETGETSNGEAGESSGNEASSGNQKGEEGTETNNDQTSNGENSDDQASAGTVNEGATVDKTFENTVGLPSWIKEKKSFLNNLLKIVDQQPKTPRKGNKDNE
uniref:Putative secreted protein n=1 Tax=Ixodes ricinus TaxID=34613 RepID=V5HD43_IXORI